MAEHSGFFDSLKNDDDYDRMYSSDDYCDNLATIITNGVRYSPDNDLNVTPAGGMVLNVSMGRAWINGHYYYNDSTFTDIVVPTAPTGSNKRIDRVVIRLDTSIPVRKAFLMLKQGTASVKPEPPTLERNDNVYELAIADIYINPAQTVIGVKDIVDQRENENVCGWAASVTRAVISLLKRYKWRTVLEEQTSIVTFFIPQYEADSVHILKVYTNGILETEGTAYTVKGNAIVFASLRQAGTEIKVEVYKSIDGTGLASVADEMTELQNAVASMSGDSENVYLCNGANDNVELSQIAQNWLDGGTDYACKIIRVVGTFGMSAAFGGLGTSESPYRWISVGTGTAVNRKIIFDFSACSQISFPVAAGTNNILFYGANSHIIGANATCTQVGAGTIIKCFSNAPSIVRAENCRFWLTSYQDSMIANTGTFIDCRGSVTNTINNSYCFQTSTDGLLRLEGGEYYAYTSETASKSAVVGQSATNAVAVLYGVNAPTAARSGLYQTDSILQFAGGGILNCTDLVTLLPVTVASGSSNIRGTIAKNKAGMM